MQIEQSFTVRARAQEVWNFLVDPNRVAACLPGAAITERTGDQTWAGTITVKVGPVTSSYRGTLRFTTLDPAAREAVIAASGQDVRGKGGAELTMTSRVIERAPGETEVQVTSEVTVTGILAQFGRGMIQDVSDQLFRQFTDAMRVELERELTPQGTRKVPKRRESIDVALLGRVAAGGIVGRVVRHPLFWIAAAALVLWLVWQLSR